MMTFVDPIWSLGEPKKAWILKTIENFLLNANQFFQKFSSLKSFSRTFSDKIRYVTKHRLMSCCVNWYFQWLKYRKRRKSFFSIRLTNDREKRMNPNRHFSLFSRIKEASKWSWVSKWTETKINVTNNYLRCNDLLEKRNTLVEVHWQSSNGKLLFIVKFRRYERKFILSFGFTFVLISFFVIDHSFGFTIIFYSTWFRWFKFSSNTRSVVLSVVTLVSLDIEFFVHSKLIQIHT